MANPQPDKFTKFSNELLEAYIKIARFLSPYENAVWLCIFRKTYGFKQKEDWIALRQIENMTGIRQPHVARTKKKLLFKNMIANNSARLSIQKNYDQWHIPKQVYLNGYDIPKQVLPKQVITLTQTGNSHLPKQVSLTLPKQVDTKDTIKDTSTKDTITKETTVEVLKQTSSVNILFEHFCIKFQETQGKEYIASFAKDKKILKDLLNKIPIEELKRLIDIYLGIPDKFCEEAGYTIGVFKIRINSLRIEKKTLIVSDKTLKSIMAGKNWLKRKEGENAG